MKYGFLLSLIFTTLLMSGCAQRLADFTLASTKNINLNGNTLVTGRRVIGEDMRPLIILPLGVPNIKEAADEAIEVDKCAVGLTDVTVDSEFFYFLIGYVKYRVEGDLVIDKSLPGCDKRFWTWQK